MLPKRREPQRMGVKDIERREWPRHRRFVRSHKCAVDGKNSLEDYCEGPIEFAHLRLGTHTGMKQKPHDRYGISLCTKHHLEAHYSGEDTFQRKYRIDWMKLADEFVRKSPDLRMKASMSERGRG